MAKFLKILNHKIINVDEIVTVNKDWCNASYFIKLKLKNNIIEEMYFSTNEERDSVFEEISKHLGVE